MAPRGRILATAGVAQVLNVASTTMVTVALPQLSVALHAGDTAQQWIVDAFVLVFASLLVVGGSLGDRYGHRGAMLVGLAVFAAGSLWCAVAPTTGWLISGRVVQALGPPLTIPATLALVNAAYDEPRERAKAIGIWGASSGIGLASGPLLGGVVVDGLGWRWVFGINVPVALLLVFVTFVVVPRDRADAGVRPDLAGAVLFTGGLAFLVYGLIEGRSLGWGSLEVVGVLVAALVLLAAFVRRSLTHDDPLIDLALLREPPFAAANFGAGVIFGALTATAVFVSIFLQRVQGHSALEAGLTLLPQGTLTALLAPVSGRWNARSGPRPPIAAGMAILIAGFVALLPMDAGTSLLETSAAYALLGAGIGLALPTMTAVALDSARVGAAGMAGAIHQTSRQLGQTFAVAILGTIVFAATDYVDGLHAAIATAAVALGVTAAIVLALLRRTGLPHP